MARGIMIIQIFILKVINNKRKVLTHHKIIDRMTEQSDQRWWSLSDQLWEALKKLHMQLEISSCLGYSPESFNL